MTTRLQSLRRIIWAIGLMQGIPGLISYADQTVTVSQRQGAAECTSIQDAFNVMYYDPANYDGAKCTLHENWTIEVLDDATYDENVLIWKVGTSETAGLTINANGATIYPVANSGPGPQASALTIVDTDFVTIRGFIFKNHPDFPKDPTKSHAMTGFQDSRDQAPANGQVTFENCVWDGQGQHYNVKGFLLLWYPHGNITVEHCTFQNCNANSWSWLTLDQWNAKTPTDGIDSWGSLPAPTEPHP